MDCLFLNLMWYLKRAGDINTYFHINLSFSTINFCLPKSLVSTLCHVSCGSLGWGWTGRGSPLNVPAKVDSVILSRCVQKIVKLRSSTTFTETNRPILLID